ncbi:MAG: discoidin domain-containing protein [bacterium]
MSNKSTRGKFFKRTIIALSVMTIVLVQAVVVFAGFVQRQGTQFSLDGSTFYFAGTNCYDLFTYGDGGDYTDPDLIENQFMDKARIDAHMEVMQRNGVKVVRLWGFSHEIWHGFEPSEGTYYEPEFMLFDYLLQSAEAHDLKLWVVLENYWDAYGGIDQRLQWEGLPSGTHAARTAFFRDAGCKEQYKNYANNFVNRVNHYDGVAYKDDPTIFAWELMNEPRYQDGGEDSTGITLRAWVDEMASYIKNLDPNHMVSTGLEGHGLAYNFGGDEGNPFIYIHQSPYIDFTSAHPYPTEHWADLSLEETLDLISQWISDSHNIVGKPFVMGEHNVHTYQVDRSVWWQAMYDRFYDERGDGDCFWWLEDTQVDGNFGVRDGDAALDVFKAHSDRMAALNGPVNGSPATPAEPTGPTAGDLDVSYSYSATTTDPDGDNIRYTFDWDDGTSTTTGYVTSGTTGNASHSWNTARTYNVKVKAEDVHGASSGWSASHAVVIGGGDVTPPAAPSNVSVTDAEIGGRLDISWTNPTDADFAHIHIYRSTISGQLGSLVFDNLTVSSQTDAGLTNGTAYYYTLRSIDTSNNESTNTDQYSGVPSGVPALYDFENGTTQNWVNDTTIYFSNNLGTPSNSSAQAQKGSHSLSYPLNLNEKDPTYGVINDAGFVNPNPAQNLSSDDGITIYVMIPSDASITVDKPAKGSVYIKTGSSWNWFESDSAEPLTLGVWNPISIDFSSARNGNGDTGQTVTNLTDVREIGVHVTGASTASGSTTLYVDSVKAALETSPNNAPNVPATPSGPTSLAVATNYTYSTSSTDPDADSIAYVFDWNDGTTTTTGYVASGTSENASHSWTTPGNYNIRAKARDIKGMESTWSSVLAVTVQGDSTPPAAPSNIQVLNPEVGGRLDISWTNPADADFAHIHIYRSTVSGQIGSLIHDNVTGTSISDTGLTNGTLYYYTLRSVDTSANESTNTDQHSGTPTSDVTPPTAPANIQIADPAIGTALDISWTNPSDADFAHIHIYRSTVSGQLGSLVHDNVTATSKQDTGLTQDITYYYTLRSVDTTGSESTNTDQYSGTPTLLVNLALHKAAVSSSNDGFAGPASDVTDGNTQTRWASAWSDPQWIYVDLEATYSIDQVVLNWESAYGRAYNIDISYDASNWTSVYSTTSGNGGVDTITFTPTDARYVRMYGTQRATEWGYSLWEFEVYGSTDPDTTPPAPPSNVQVVDAASGSQLNISWTNPTDADFAHIHIYRSTVSGQIGSLVHDNVTGTSKQDTGLTNGTAYYYTVRSVDNSNNESANTDQYSGIPTGTDTTPPAAPTNIVVSDPETGNALDVSWTNPTDADFAHIHIYRSTVSGQLGNLVYDNVTGTSLQDTGLTTDTVYYYTLKAVDTTGNESTNADQYSGTPTTPSVDVNLALGKNAYASSQDGSAGSPSYVTDGNMKTRWSSSYNDNEWIYIDLSSQKMINKVMLFWEKAYGRAYEIQISNDASNWNTVYITDQGDGDSDEVLFTRTSARYVRMQGVERGTKWGYSLWEFEIYNASSDDTTPPGPPVNVQVTDPGVGGELSISWTNPNNPDFSHIHIYRSTVSGEIGNMVYDNVMATSLQDTGLTNDVVYYYTLRSVDTNANESTNSDQHSGTPTIPVNLALGKEAFASSNDGYAGPASNVCDGNMGTRWASEWGNNHSIYIDLGAQYDFDKVVLYWETAYGKTYRIDVSNDASSWTTVFRTTAGDGGKDEITFAATSARYVKMYGERKATNWGFSIWEFEVYNTSSSQASIAQDSKDVSFNEVYSYPNPAKRINPTIHIDTTVSVDTIEISIYDIAGDLVHSANLDGSSISIGGNSVYEYTWDVSNVASGIYVYRIRTEQTTVVKKIAVIK